MKRASLIIALLTIGFSSLGQAFESSQILRYVYQEYRGRPIKVGVLMSDSVYNAIKFNTDALKDKVDIFRQAYVSEQNKVLTLNQKSGIQANRIRELEINNTVLRRRVETDVKVLKMQSNQLKVYRKKFYEFRVLGKELRLHRWSINIGIPLLVGGTFLYMSK